MGTSGKRPGSEEEDSGVHKGFYEHSTGGKMPRVQPPPKAPPPAPRPSAAARAARAVKRLFKKA